MSGSGSRTFALAALYNNNGKHFMFQNTGVIGRSPRAFLCLMDSFISRTHCIIEKTEDNKFTICDMSSSGTFLNDKRLIKNIKEELKNMDRIKLADKEAYSYVFIINKKVIPCVKSPERGISISPLTEEMIDLNETQNLEKESMEKELNLVQSEMVRLKQELQEKLKAREDELERERLKISLESAHNKEEAEQAKIQLNATVKEKEQVMEEYEHKIADIMKKVEDLQKTKNEMEKRHQIERDELESKCKAEIENLKKKLEKSELQNQQFEELQARLEETKNILLESELEQQLLFEAKVEVETKLESKIVDLTNEKENKTEKVKELEMKLKEKEELEEKLKKEIEGLEDDMMCSICAELYIEPTALNCGHMFCKLCINQWSKKNKICPMCRTKISTTVRIYNMDSVIQRNIRLMSEEAQSHREAVIAERKRGKTPQKNRNAKKRRHSASRIRVPSPEPLVAQRMHPEPFVALRMHPEPMAAQRMHPEPFVALRMHPEPLVARLRDRVSRAAIDLRTAYHPSAPNESEGDDPFQIGWVNTQHISNGRRPERNSPVAVAAVDLTDIPMIEIPAPTRIRPHTVTSADANLSTIDLTDL